MSKLEIKFGQEYWFRVDGTELVGVVERDGEGFVGEGFGPYYVVRACVNNQKYKVPPADVLRAADDGPVLPEDWTALSVERLVHYTTQGPDLRRAAAVEVRRRILEDAISPADRQYFTQQVQRALATEKGTTSTPPSGPVASVAPKPLPKPVRRAEPEPTPAKPKPLPRPISKTVDALPLMRYLAESPAPAPAGEVAAVVTIPQKAPSALVRKLEKALASETELLPHVIIRALAGTGKTTTVIEQMKVAAGMEPSIVPSEQQARIWVAMLTGQVGDEAPTLEEVLREKKFTKPRTAAFCAFGNKIADTLAEKLQGTGYEGMTLHRLGYRIIRNNVSGVGINEHRCTAIIEEVTGLDLEVLRSPANQGFLDLTQELVRLCKINLVEPTKKELDRLVSFYELEIEDEDTGEDLRERVYEVVPQVLERARNVGKDREVDFSDMIWLPVVNKMRFTPFDLLVVDEGQDLNNCQHALALMAGRRIVIVGDHNQAIMGFAGSNTESLDDMERKLGDTERGAVILPLTQTRRCPKKIVASAQEEVPEFEALPDAPEGEILEALYPIQYRGMGTREPYEIAEEESYLPLVRPGDMILCRVSAPLVRQYFKLRRRRVPAKMLGRKLGEGLVRLIKKIADENATSADMIKALGEWLKRETDLEKAKRHPSDSKLLALNDRHDCLTFFAREATTRKGVIDLIEDSSVSDKKGEVYQGVLLCSIHKGKGLEAERVFFLQIREGPCPHPLATLPWEIEQERHLRYVGKTRTKKTLVWVRN